MGKNLSIEDYDKIRRSIIKKLFRADAWGTGHMLVVRLKSGVKSHLRGHVKGVVRDLLSSEILKSYGKTKFGGAVYLNVEKKDEIEKIIWS